MTPRCCSDELRAALVQPLVLASASPRRSALLAQVGIDFEVVVSAVDEDGDADADPRALALCHAREKALDVAGRVPGRVVLGADTVVVLGERTL